MVQGGLVYYFSAVCSFLQLCNALCSLNCQGLRIWGRTEEERVAFSTAGSEHDNEMCVYARACRRSACSLRAHTAGPVLNCYTGVTNTHLWAIAYIFCFKRAYIYIYIYCIMQQLPFSLPEQLV